MVLEVIVVGGAVTGVALAAVVAKSLAFARRVLDDEAAERERRRAELPPREPRFFDHLPVRRNAGELKKCPYCGRDQPSLTGEPQKLMRTHDWIEHRLMMRNGRLTYTPSTLAKAMYGNADKFRGPTTPLAHVDAPDGPMLFQACCSCGSEWLVKPKD